MCIRDRAYTERFEAGSFDLPAADLPRSESRVDLLEYFSGRSFKHTPGDVYKRQGWETIGGIIVEDELNLGFSTKQGVDFYRDAFGHWNSTEAIVWPSSEGDACLLYTSQSRRVAVLCKPNRGRCARRRISEGRRRWPS